MKMVKAICGSDNDELSNDSWKNAESKKEHDIVLQMEPLQNKVAGNAEKPIKLSEKAVEMFFEEPELVTEDHMVAIQGFRTKDDEQLCNFYDPVTGACFKGARCKLRHVAKISDGISCTDNTEVYIYEDDLRNHPLPALHSKVKIEITHFKNATSFYCRYYKLKPTRSGHTLETLTNHMNKEEEIKTYALLEGAPSIMQLVLVKSDDIFRRGRIEHVSDEDENITVLLVDLGTLENHKSNKLYQYCPRFDYLPFQTVEMEITNILPLAGDFSRAAIDRILTYLEGSEKKYLKALIYDNIGSIKCALFTYEEEDIGEKLVDEGFAQAKVVQAATPKNAFFLPV